MAEPTSSPAEIESIQPTTTDPKSTPRTNWREVREWATFFLALGSLLLFSSYAAAANQVQGHLATLEEQRNLAKLQIVDAMAVTIGLEDRSQSDQSHVLLRIENRGLHASAVHAIRIWAKQPEGNEIGLIGSLYDSPKLVFNFSENRAFENPGFSRSIASGEQAHVAISLPSFVGATSLRLQLEPVIGDVFAWEISAQESPPFRETFRVFYRLPPGTTYYEGLMAN